MSSIVVSGDTSGSVTLSAPAVSGSSVLTLPAVTDTLAGIAATQTLTNKTLTTPKGLQASITLGPGSGTDFKSGATFVGFGSWNQNVTVVAIDYQYIQAAQDNTVEALQYKVGGDSAVTIATFTGYSSGNSHRYIYWFNISNRKH